MPDFDQVFCPGCGALQPGGAEGCELRFQELTIRDFQDVRYFPTHRVLVDCYAMQHPEQYAVSGKSFAAHLTGLCVWLEHGGDVQLNRAIQQWLSTNPPLERPTPPESRGRLTILDLEAAASIAEHRDIIQAWAHSIWEAYADYHTLARTWIKLVQTHHA